MEVTETGKSPSWLYACCNSNLPYGPYLEGDRKFMLMCVAFHQEVIGILDVQLELELRIPWYYMLYSVISHAARVGYGGNRFIWQGAIRSIEESIAVRESFWR